MTFEEFLREFNALTPEDKRRVMMAIGPQFCHEAMSQPDTIQEMWRWCRSFMPPDEMRHMMDRMMHQKP
jgi:hypothetical protein